MDRKKKYRRLLLWFLCLDLLADCENAGMTLKDIIDMVRVLGEK